jgi:putative hydrolase of the HAD superfamily
MELFKKDQKHVFDNLFKIDSLNSILNVYKKEDLIKLYREHLPSIKLSSKMLSLLNKIKTKNLFLSILSDGRKKSQELKIKSLGLDKIVEKIILTDSLGSQMEFWKPHTYGFKLLLDHFNIESNQSCYIGDNLVKDFVAPNKLGMTSILFKNKNGLYNLENQNTSQCEFIVNSVSELENLIFK